MDVARCGNHLLMACPFCDSLFDTPVADEGYAESLSRLQEQYDAHLVESDACFTDNANLPDIGSAIEALSEAFDEADTKHGKELDDNPDNGKLGYWYVDGIRHDATCKAASAREAVQKCNNVVGSWESPTVRFIGAELPEVW